MKYVPAGTSTVDPGRNSRSKLMSRDLSSATAEAVTPNAKPITAIRKIQAVAIVNLAEKKEGGRTASQQKTPRAITRGVLRFPDDRL
ncbi:MAG: hypothetical protein QM775_26160 [Pirellulales bacterium]